MFLGILIGNLDLLHSKCKVCQQYLVNEEMLLDHMDLSNTTTVAPEPVVTEKSGNRGSSDTESWSPGPPGDVSNTVIGITLRT